MDQRMRRLIMIVLSLITTYLLYLLLPGIMVVLKFAFRVLLPFVIGFVIAFILYPLVNYLNKHGIPQKMSVFVVVLLSVFLIVSLFSFIIPLLIDEISAIMNNIPHYISRISDILENLSDRLEFLPENVRPTPENIESLILSNLNAVMNYFARIIQRTFSYFFVLIISPMLAIYFLLDFDKIESWLREKSAGAQMLKRRLLLIELKDTMQAYFKGVFWIIIILSCLSTLGFTIVGLDYALIFGLIVGFTDIIPYIGPYIGGAIVFMGALTVSFNHALRSVIVIVIIQLIESSFLTPKIQGHHIKAHPILVVFALAFFGEILGIFGMLIAVPVLAVTQIFIRALKK
ncbi:MAG: AI-2E family transporter [Bacilli bacterium]